MCEATPVFAISPNARSTHIVSVTADPPQSLHKAYRPLTMQISHQKRPGIAKWRHRRPQLSWKFSQIRSNAMTAQVGGLETSRRAKKSIGGDVICDTAGANDPRADARRRDRVAVRQRKRDTSRSVSPAGVVLSSNPDDAANNHRHRHDPCANSSGEVSARCAPDSRE